MEDEIEDEEECDGQSLCGGEGEFVESYNDPSARDGYGERITPCSCRKSKNNNQ